MGRTQTIKLLGFFSLLIFLVSGGSLSYAQTNTFPDDGNVGIGTTSPIGSLHVGTAADSQVFVGSTTDPGWGGAALQLRNRATFFSSSDAAGFWIGYNVYFDGSDRRYIAAAPIATLTLDGNIWFRTGPSESAGSVTDDYISTHMMIDGGSGNVGIGTTSPSSKLHVAGDAKITGNLTTDGNIAAKYQDVAEWVPAAAPIGPGTVVVIDPLENNRVLPASQPYDTRVAGVVSAQPGIILGEAGEDKAKVAHSGRVKVKVDAQFGSIQVGDLLVSSDTAGYAMRSTPIEMNGTSIHRPGTIVGKALEPLKEGQGEILVLLTLQ